MESGDLAHLWRGQSLQSLKLLNIERFRPLQLSLADVGGGSLEVVQLESHDIRDVFLVEV